MREQICNLCPTGFHGELGVLQAAVVLHAALLLAVLLPPMLRAPQATVQLLLAVLLPPMLRAPQATVQLMAVPALQQGLVLPPLPLVQLVAAAAHSVQPLVRFSVVWLSVLPKDSRAVSYVDQGSR